MATDKRLDQVSTLTDFDYALIVKGDQVAKASKQQLAELVGNLLYGATNASSLATVVAGYLPFVSDMAYGVYNLSEMDSKTKEGVYVLADVPSEEYGCIFVFAAKNHFIFQILLSANKAKFRRCNYGQTFDGIGWVALN